MTTLVCTYGRFQPPSRGHEYLIDKVIQEATLASGDAKIFISHSSGSYQNPLGYMQRWYILKQSYPNIIVDDFDEIFKSPFSILEYYSGRYSDLIFVCGKDRLKEYKEKFEKYNKVLYHYNSIRVVEAIGREKYSGSRLRQFAYENNFHDFFKEFISRDIEFAKRIFTELREVYKR